MACVFEVVGAFLGREGVEKLADRGADGLDGPGLGLSEQALELCEGLLDGVQIGRVFGEEDPSGVHGSDGAAHGLGLVAAEVDAARPLTGSR